MTGLYSINLRIMDKRPTISLFGFDSIFLHLISYLAGAYAKTIVLFLRVRRCHRLHACCFSKRKGGLALRATGDNEVMVQASSINTDRMKILGLALWMPLLPYPAPSFAPAPELADLSSGIGMMVIGLALNYYRRKSDSTANPLLVRLIQRCCWGNIYRYILTIALQFGIEASDLKLLSAISRYGYISIPSIQSAIAFRRRKGRSQSLLDLKISVIPLMPRHR